MSDEMDDRLDADDDLGIADLRHPPEDVGISLDELSQAYANLVQRGHDPYDPASETEGDVSAEPGDEITADDMAAAPSERDNDVTPRGILEAMLFVGTPDNSPLTSKQIASLMRGVRANEIDDSVEELNADYEAAGHAWRIVSDGPGYRMVLRDEFRSIRDKFYGRIKEARLSQAAIDVLAIVAYNQPLMQGDVDKLRGKPSGGVLSQLVRRQLLRIERPDKKPRTPKYFTTNRFLELFGIAALEDLPRSE